MVPIPSFLLALALGPLARGAEVVVVPLADLPAPLDVQDEAPPVRVIVADTDVTLRPGAETGVRLRWHLQVLEPGWVDLPLVGEDLALSTTQLDGLPVSLLRPGDGWRRLAVSLPQGDHVVELEGSVATPGAVLQLPATRGVRGRLRAASPGMSFTVADGLASGAGVWDLLPGTRLDVQWAPERPPPPRPRVVQVEGAVALRGGEDGVEGAAQFRYRVVDGTVSELRLRLPGGVEQLEVTGPRVAGHRVVGEELRVTLTEPVSGRIPLALAWRGSPPPAAPGPAPVPQPVDARGSSTISLVRGDDSVLIPAPGRGLTAVPNDAVPRWGRGLVAGQPLVSYRTDAAERARLQWQRLAWEPVDAPPTLIDEARYTVVHAAHGRVHVRAAYQVRNDRNPFLRLRLPDGWQAVGVRVAGRTTEPARSADGRWLVPLEKSVETLDGLVAFPVELMLIGDEPAWERRGLRALETPAVDAPIAYARWEVRLPRELEQRAVRGRATLVDAWTPPDQGVLIGRATGTTLEPDGSAPSPPGGRASRRQREKTGAGGVARSRSVPSKGAPSEAAAQAVSQEYWNRAYSAYKDNRFDEAEALLEQSLAYDASNASAQSLRDNVSVLQGDAELDADQQAAANRVRELARARTSGVALAQADKAAEAERRLRAGDRAGARAAYEELVTLTEQLAAVEQAEAVDQKRRLDTYRQQVAELAVDDDERPPPVQTGASTGSLARDGRASDRLSIDGLARLPSARGYGASIGALAAASLAPESVTVVIPDSSDEAALLDEALGGFAYGVGGGGEFEGGVVAGVVGGVMGAALGGAAVPETEPAVAAIPPPADAPAEPVLEWKNDMAEDLALERVEAESTLAEDTLSLLDARPQPRPAPVERLEAREVQRMSGAVVTTERRRAPLRSALARLRSARHPVASPPPPSEPAVAFPRRIRPNAPPVDSASPAPAFPQGGGGSGALPVRPPPPPPAPFGLDVPAGVTASTLSLSLPDTGAGLLLEQRLLPSDEPLRLTLTYRQRR